MKDPLIASTSGLLMLAAVIWYLALQTGWFQDRLGIGRGNAFAMALGLWGMTTLVIAALGAVQVV